MLERPSPTLTARERRALRDIEHQLRSEDPALADELEFRWWRRRLLTSPGFWAWIAAGAVAMVIGFLAGGVVVAAFVCFVLAVLALDRFVAGAFRAPSSDRWSSARTMFGLDPDAEPSGEE